MFNYSSSLVIADYLQQRLMKCDNVIVKASFVESVTLPTNDNFSSPVAFVQELSQTLIV